MNLETKLRHTGVYWPPAANDDYGHAGADTAQEIVPDSSTGGCRFEDDFLTILQATGKMNNPLAKVWYDASKITVEKNGWLYRGTLASLSTEEKADPRLIKDVARVKQLSPRDNLDTTQTLGKALCSGK